MVNNTQSIAWKLYDIWNIDSSNAQFSLRLIPKEEQPENKIFYEFLDKLLSATGVTQGLDDHSLDIDEGRLIGGQDLEKKWLLI